MLVTPPVSREDPDLGDPSEGLRMSLLMETSKKRASDVSFDSQTLNPRAQDVVLPWVKSAVPSSLGLFAIVQERESCSPSPSARLGVSCALRLSLRESLLPMPPPS